MNEAPVKTISTVAFSDQKPGTSGLRKKTRVFMQSNYLENFVQSVFNAVKESAHVDFSKEILVVGGDGRYYNRAAIQTIVRMAVANGFHRVMIGRGGILSTPAMSAVIRRRGALGGLVLSASHNPGGIDADFGIKYNIRNGGPAPEGVTNGIYKYSLELSEYRTIEFPDLDLDHQGSTKINSTEVEIIDPIEDYLAVMESLFDFEALRALFKSGFRMLFDAMHAVTGPYAREIFENRLGAPAGTVMNGTPLEDFGGGHPDPNLVYAAELVARMAKDDAPDFAGASDGDGDRNLILGKNFFVTPGDSVAIIAEHAQSAIPGYKNGLSGVARSMPTSTAVDRVAKAYGIPHFETPTGWKFFGNLMDADKCTICGEESFGTGSNHVREKDGVWAVLSWLSILAKTRKPVKDVVVDHWHRFGRSYYQRHDYEGLDAKVAAGMIAELQEKLSGMQGSALVDSQIALADDFSYTDPVDNSVSAHQGIRIILADGSRIIGRLSGTGTEGATLRIYLERYNKEDVLNDIDQVLHPLAQAAGNIFQLKERFQRDKATIIT